MDDIIQLNKPTLEIQHTYQNNVWFMLWEILTDETDPDKVMEYIRTKIFKRAAEREELRKTGSGWHYAVYEE